MPLASISNPWKHQKNQWFSDIFRGYRNRPLAWNGFVHSLQFTSARKLFFALSYPLTHFLSMHPFSTPWKHQKTVRFLNVLRVSVFRGYRKGALGTKGLIYKEWFFVWKKKCFAQKIFRFLYFWWMHIFQNMRRHHRYYHKLEVTIPFASFKSSVV